MDEDGLRTNGCGSLQDSRMELGLSAVNNVHLVKVSREAHPVKGVTVIRPHMRKCPSAFPRISAAGDGAVNNMSSVGNRLKDDHSTVKGAGFSAAGTADLVSSFRRTATFC